jgi:hypothetical protein
MDGDEFLYRLKFHNDTIVDEDVYTEIAVEFRAIVDYGYFALTFYREPFLLQFVCQSLFIDGFQQAWAQLLVNVIGASSDFIGDGIGIWDVGLFGHGVDCFYFFCF